MQTNRFLSPKTTLAIDERVEKLLKDLGNPAPPLCLDDVRTLLKLDLGYYSSVDDSWLREKIHQMRVAGKQVLARPASILSIVKNLGLKGGLLAEKRRILLDSETPGPKQRWNEAHEITHDLVPWHEGIAHGDPETTLSPGCHELIEAEANYGAGRLLFLGKTFDEVVRSSESNFALIQALTKRYGNTYRSAEYVRKLHRAQSMPISGSLQRTLAHFCGPGRRDLFLPDPTGTRLAGQLLSSSSGAG